MKLFGYEFRREQPQSNVTSFAPKENDDGAVIVAAAGAYGTYLDLDGTVRTEAELVSRYREMSLQPEVDAAIDEVVNESIAVDEEDIVEIDLEKVNATPKVQKVIREEFERILKLLNFNRVAYEIYRRWYIDGRLYYHAIIDEKDPAAGLKELRYVDPRKIRKVREIAKKRARNGLSGLEGGEGSLPHIQNEYFIYNDRGFNYASRITGPGAATGLRIAKDSIVHVTSGLTDTQGTMVLSYLHKAIKALNQLRTLEDALVIYRLARAPERRIWYIDVGNLPKMKAEQYVRDIMVKHKNRLIYDGATGEVRDDRKFMTMLEDYWLPRREGGRGTEVTTLPGGQTLGEMDDVLYFQRNLYQTLNVPIGRLNSEELFSLGRATEITREELKFAKFITRLRNRFAALFSQLLEKQLVLKGIMSIEDWQLLAPAVKYKFTRDNHFTELKNAEVLQNRAAVMMAFEPMLGKYYSFDWARRNILQQSDDDIEEQDAQMQEEQNDPRFVPPAPMGPDGEPMDPAAGGAPPDAAGPADAGGGDGPSQEDKVREAQTTKDLLGRKSAKNRSMQDEAKYRSATTVLAKAK